MYVQHSIIFFSSRFGSTCHLAYDGQVTCECPQGYAGRRCEICDRGYTGNPNRPGDSCIPASSCATAGSLATEPDANGQCSCKVRAHSVLPLKFLFRFYCHVIFFYTLTLNSHITVSNQKKNLYEKKHC